MTFNYLPLDYNKKSNNGNIVIKQAGRIRVWAGLFCVGWFRVVDSAKKEAEKAKHNTCRRRRSSLIDRQASKAREGSRKRSKHCFESNLSERASSVSG